MHDLPTDPLLHSLHLGLYQCSSCWETKIQGKWKKNAGWNHTPRRPKWIVLHWYMGPSVENRLQTEMQVYWSPKLDYVRFCTLICRFWMPIYKNIHKLYTLYIGSRNGPKGLLNSSSWFKFKWAWPIYGKPLGLGQVGQGSRSEFGIKAEIWLKPLLSFCICFWFHSNTSFFG